MGNLRSHNSKAAHFHIVRLQDFYTCQRNHTETCLETRFIGNILKVLPVPSPLSLSQSPNNEMRAHRYSPLFFTPCTFFLLHLSGLPFMRTHFYINTDWRWCFKRPTTSHHPPPRWPNPVLSLQGDSVPAGDDGPFADTVTLEQKTSSIGGTSGKISLWMQWMLPKVTVKLFAPEPAVKKAGSTVSYSSKVQVIYSFLSQSLI